MATERDLAAALVTIEHSIDPCGESAELAALVAAFRRCWNGACRICLDTERERNTTERGDAESPITITWNPELRSELQRGCGSDPVLPVRRDPTASLVHELVHALQAVRGAPFAETEAVRIENVYRRARGLCQRTRYGEQVLPAALLLECAPDQCSCQPAGTTTLRAAAAPLAGERTAGDVAGTRRRR